METPIPLLEMLDITKRFSGVLANDHISFTVHQGEIHSLLGENGAGKTTFMNILYGLVASDSGKIFIRGQEVQINSPLDAIKLGIGMVHQHFMLVERLNVVENIIVGTHPPGYPLYNKKGAVERISKLIDKYGFDIDPLTPVSLLSVGQQQRVEITKALYRGADLLILDEPSSVLTPPEVEDMFRLLRDLRSAGHGVVFISHKLNETLTISDRITVIRRGRLVDTLLPKETDKANLANLMVGRKVLFDIPHPKYKGQQDFVLDVKDLSVFDDRKVQAVKEISFNIKDGEILGIAGVDGNGQRELIEALTGLRASASGSVTVSGSEILGLHPDQILEKSVAHIPEDRQRRGLVMFFRVDENLVLHDFNRAPFTRYGLMQHKAVFLHAKRQMVEYDIRPPQPALKAQQFSGGNQQKIILARELSKEPKLIIAMQPTRGLDVGAAEFVQQKLIEARSNGAAILLVSTELDEVLLLSDVIAIMYEGRIVGQMKRSEFDIERIGLLMGGADFD